AGGQAGGAPLGRPLVVVRDIGAIDACALPHGGGAGGGIVGVRRQRPTHVFDERRGQMGRVRFGRASRRGGDHYCGAHVGVQLGGRGGQGQQRILQRRARCDQFQQAAL